MTDLLALTVRQPFAWLLAEAIKDVENRSQPFARRHVGERVGLHVSANYVFKRLWNHLDRARPYLDQSYIDFCMREALRDQCGHIIATAVIDRVIEHGDGDPLNDSPWRTPDRFGIVFRDVAKLAEPVPAKGFLGL